jgi:hypothetical protein
MIYAGRHQTWTWDGSTWQSRPQGELPAGSLAFDPTTQRAVLVAPEDSNCSSAGCLTTSWTWNGTAWTRPLLSTSPRLPATRYSSSPPPLTYDPALGALILLVSAN